MTMSPERRAEIRAAGFFRDPKTNPAVIAPATHEATRCAQCHELHCICATLTTTEDPPHV